MYNSLSTGQGALSGFKLLQTPTERLLSLQFLASQVAFLVANAGPGRQIPQRTRLSAGLFGITRPSTASTSIHSICRPGEDPSVYVYK